MTSDDEGEGFMDVMTSSMSFCALDVHHQGQQQTPSADAMMPVIDNIQQWVATPWEDA